MIQKESLTEIAAKYIEIVNQIKELEEQKEKLRNKLIYSEEEKIKSKNGTVKILTKKNAVLDDEKIIFTLNKEELTKVATISVSKFRKFAERKFDINDFIIGYKETKEVRIILPDE
jgi:K+ transporter